MGRRSKDKAKGRRREGYDAKTKAKRNGEAQIYLPVFSPFPPRWAFMLSRQLLSLCCVHRKKREGGQPGCVVDASIPPLFPFRSLFLRQDKETRADSPIPPTHTFPCSLLLLRWKGTLPRGRARPCRTLPREG